MRLEKEELPDDVESRDVWNSWLQLRENEAISGKDAPIN
jgi:hypothetical protein